jgi:hypothetical protein
LLAILVTGTVVQDSVDPRLLYGPVVFAKGSPARRITMTITDIGILLVILCVLLWAIMAALHRHTVQLETLRKELEALRQAQPCTNDDAGEASTTKPRDNLELSTHASRKW